MPISYDPYDGDYTDADYDRLPGAVQVAAGYDFGEYLEICVGLESDHTLRVLGSNEQGDEWIWDQSFPIPLDWDLEHVQKMFVGNVYLKPVERWE